MVSIICKNCGKSTVVPNSNTLYCQPCKKIVKDRTSADRYARINMQADPCWLNEKILRKYYGQDMDPELLFDEGFEYKKYNRKVNINDQTVFGMKTFGFSILENQKIRIWKIM
jgi:hypothetical protein